MMTKRYYLFFIFVLFFIPMWVNAQQVELNNMTDTIKAPVDSFHYAPESTTTEPSKLKMSFEAYYWAHWKRDSSSIISEDMTFRDTIIIDHLFLPPVFQGRSFTKEELTFFSMDFMKPRFSAPELLFVESPLFNKYIRKKEFDELASRHLEHNFPSYFHYSKRNFPQEIIKTQEIRRNVYENLPLRTETRVDFSDVEAPLRFIPERRYWTSSFESTIQFAQNHISSNWHKGGSSNLNVYTKNLLKYDYKKDKVALTNEFEFRTSLYTAPKDTVHEYKVGDDVLRLRSNLGFVAFNKWSYTIDGEIKTQVFPNYMENTKIKQAAFLAPLSINLGLGMKYDLSKTFKDRYKNLKLAINLAPLSFTYMYSTMTENIDLGRHGFKKDEITNKYSNSLTQVGSTIRADLTCNFSRDVTWQSRVYYFTTYERVVAEYENTFSFALSRFFETRIYLHLRFDDGVTRMSENNSYLQINELLSFGFKYKW